MAAPRLRIQLGLAHDGPPKFWWQPSPAAQTVADVLEELAAHLGLAPGSAARLAASMDGFAVLPGSRTELLQDGDLLLVSLTLGRKRRPAEVAADGQAGQQVKRVKAPAAVQPPPAHVALPAPAAVPAGGSGRGSSSSSSSEEESSSSEEESSSSSSEEESSSSSSEEAESSSSEEESSSSSESSSSGEEEESSGEGHEAGGRDAGRLMTPAAAAQAQDGSAAKQPSRSARRKAAKRRLRRMGVLPPKAAAQAGRGTAAPAAHAGAADKHANKQASGAAAAPLPGQTAAAQRQQAGKQQQREQQTVAGVPEVAVPVDWQQHWEEPEAHQRPQPKRARQGKERQPQQQQQQQQQAQQQPMQAAGPAAQVPMAETAFVQLPPLAGLPGVGDVLAYRLLEVGPTLQPGVSEVRCGRVSAVDAARQEVTLAPQPDPAVHPLAYQRSLRAAQRKAAAAAAGGEAEEEVEEDEEELGSLYDEDGSLVAQLSAFVEVRLLERGPGAAAAADTWQAPAAGAEVEPTRPSGEQPAAAAAQQPDDLGPSSYSQLGPPRPAAARGDVIAPEGGWASLYQQLQQRRSQLAAHQARGGAGAGEAGGTPRGSAPPQPDGAGSAQQVRSAPPAAGASRNGGGGSNGRASSLTPGATRPRAGVRRTALGPMLRMLREAEQLQG
ncbi:hypothetical protein ABPG75_011678 [Micractinium tetrahymenae]